MPFQAMLQHSFFSYKTLTNLLLCTELNGEGLTVSHTLTEASPVRFIWFVENEHEIPLSYHSAL